MSVLEYNDDEFNETLYTNGHWDWSEKNNQLEFISEESISEEEFKIIKPLSKFDFKDELDFVEQLTFQKRYQRKTLEHDVVKLQDIKDLVLYTSPYRIMTAELIDILHIPSMERFLRALILYFQYYIQVDQELAKRELELEAKIPLPIGIIIEKELSTNLQDLRTLIAKEYCIKVLGSKEYSKYHHLGTRKKPPSFTLKDSFRFESLLKVCSQIVWIALGRKSYGRIDLEINRIFRSTAFNPIARKHKAFKDLPINDKKKNITSGKCHHKRSKLNTQTPLLNELFCRRRIDFRLMGIGVIQYPQLNDRLKYLERLLALTEEKLKDYSMSLGIIGLPRKQFDTMLRKIHINTPDGTSTGWAQSRPSLRRLSLRMARPSFIYRKSLGAAQEDAKLYPDIILPEDSSKEYIPHKFHTKLCVTKQDNKADKRKWLTRIAIMKASKKAKTLSRRNQNFGS